MLNNKPTLLFIFGGSGDLTNRKLIPALYNLYLDGWLPKQIQITGIGRSTFKTDDTYREKLLEGVKEFSRRTDKLKETWKDFASVVNYYELDLLDDATYAKLIEVVREKTAEWKEEPVVIFYLAVAPQLAPAIAKKLSAQHMCDIPASSRIVFEKPFGHDLKSALELNALLTGMFNEEQIFRIDHYLGKETVQNILAFRFANILFEPVWNSYYIDHVQITVAETVGVGDRGSYYEQAGALRDMVQNHILQLLCMIAMEPPISFDANEIRNKKVDVLHAIRILRPADVFTHAVRGQYTGGEINHKKQVAYRQEKDINPESPVETYAAIKFHIDNWRWRNTPFFIRTGKCLQEKSTVITIQFKDAPVFSFPHKSAKTWRPNRVVFRIQPEMDIRLRFQAKKPGPEMELDPVNMIFNYAESYQGKDPEAYETLLEDVITGNQTLFMRADQVEAAWRAITPILEHWEQHLPDDFPNYAPGSWGPGAADDLIDRDGRHWVNISPGNKK